MTQSIGSATESGGGASGVGSSERVVIVAQELDPRRDDGVDLIGASLLIWESKWLIAAVAAVFAVASIAYALTLTHWYRAQMLLAPAEERDLPDFARQLGGLATLAGVSVGAKDSAEPLAILQSRDFIRQFIEDEQLLPILFSEQWDAEKGSWKATNAEEWPDLRDAIKFFGENVLDVEEDRSSGLVTLSVEWIDPQVASRWAELLVKRLNERMRSTALANAQHNVDYLRKEMAATDIVALQQSMGRLLEREMQKLMLARGNEEFAFRVLDGAQVPKSPSRPRRTVIVILSTLLGGILAVFVVFVRRAILSYRASAQRERVLQES